MSCDPKSQAPGPRMGPKNPQPEAPILESHIASVKGQTENPSLSDDAGILVEIHHHWSRRVLGPGFFMEHSS